MASIRFRAFPDAAPALEALRARGLACVCVSNWDIGLGEVLERCGLAGMLDGVVVSAAVGARKPDPAIFARRARARRLRGGGGPARRRHAGRGRRRRRGRRNPAPADRPRRPARGGRDCVAGRDRPASPALTDELDRSPGPPPPPPPTAAAGSRDRVRRYGGPKRCHGRRLGPDQGARRARLLPRRGDRGGRDRLGLRQRHLLARRPARAPGAARAHPDPDRADVRRPAASRARTGRRRRLAAPPAQAVCLDGDRLLRLHRGRARCSRRCCNPSRRTSPATSASARGCSARRRRRC